MRISKDDLIGGGLVLSGAAALFLVQAQGYGWVSDAIASMALTLMLLQSRSGSSGCLPAGA